MNPKTVMDIVKRDLKQVLRSPAQLSLVILFPLAITGFFAFMFGGSTGSSISSMYAIGVINNDQVESDWETQFSNVSTLSHEIFQHGFGDHLLQSLNNASNLDISSVIFELTYFETEQDLDEAIQDRKVTMGLIIPEDFSLSILTGINNKYFVQTGSYLVNESSFMVTNSSITTHGDANSQEFQNAQTELNEAVQKYVDYFTDIKLSAGYFKVVNTPLTSITFTEFDYFFPGFIVFGVLLGSSSVAHIVGSERSHRTLERIQISSISPVEYLLGISLSQFLLLIGQICVMFVSAFIFGFNGKGNPLYALIIGTATIVPTIGLGLIIAAFDKTGHNASGIAAILSSPLGFMSGAFFPLPEITLIPNLIPQPGGVRDLQLWDLFPYANSVSAARKILLFEYDLLDVIGELLLLTIGGLFIFGIGIYLFSKTVYSNTD